MGKLITGLLLCLSTSAMAEGIPQDYKDAIREQYEKNILGSGQDLTVQQPDVALYRKMFTTPNKVDVRELPEPDVIPSPQIFKTSDLTLGQVLKLASAASGYDTEFDPQVDQNQMVKINTQVNSLADIAEYLTRVSSAQVTVYPEARFILATKKVSTHG